MLPDTGLARYWELLYGGALLPREPRSDEKSIGLRVRSNDANRCTLGEMLAGTPVADRNVLELARLLREAGFDETAEWLEVAYDREARILALPIAQREETLRALEDCPDGLAELRGVLVAEHEGRVREGLV